MRVLAFLSVVGAAAAFVPPMAASRGSALYAAGKSTKVDIGANEYIPAGLTRAQWAEIKAADAAKKANKKAAPKKIETLVEFQEAVELGKKGHRFAKMKYDGWYKK